LLQLRTAGAFHDRPGVVPPECAASSGKPMLAVYMSGMKSRLLLNSTMQRLLRPLVADGFEVHVYMSLLYSVAGTPSSHAFNFIHKYGVEDPAFANMSRDAFRDYVAGRIATTGACPMIVDVPMGPANFSGVPINEGQIASYSPNSTMYGHNLMERWLRLEGLWNKSLAVESHLKSQYSLLMWAKDNSVMLADVKKPREWLAAKDADRTVWAVKDTFYGGGVRDKMLAFGRQAAPTVMTLFSNFMRGGIPGVRTRSPEAYIKQAVLHSGMKLEIVPHTSLRELDAMLVGDEGNVSVCMIPGPRSEKLAGHAPPYQFCNKTALRMEESKKSNTSAAGTASR